eukprot:5266203-Amphidinium_carterae.1
MRVCTSRPDHPSRSAVAVPEFLQWHALQARLNEYAQDRTSAVIYRLSLGICEESHRNDALGHRE